MNSVFYIYILTSSLLLISSHPISILILILMQTLTTCLLMWIIFKTSWFSFILFLIFLGGLMVLFVYIVSLASNEKFEIKFFQVNKFSGTFLTLTVFLGSSLFFNASTSSIEEKLVAKTMLMFTDSMFLPTTFIMFYLFFALLVAVKTSSKKEGPLRNFIK